MTDLTRRQAAAVALGASVAALAAAPALANHPHMEKALEHLREAKSQLEQAENKIYEGHRGKALTAVDEAISQVKAGLDAVG